MRYLHLSTLLLAASIGLTSCSSPVYDCEEVVDETYIHRYGMPVTGEHWAESGQEGQIVSTLKNGVVVTSNYRAGTLEGERSCTFPHSSLIQKREAYHRGNLQKEMEYYTSGMPSKETMYLDNGQVRVKTWYESGTPKSDEDYLDQKLMTAQYFDLQNQIEARVHEGFGKRFNRDAYGVLIDEENVEDGLVTSKMLYYPNGSPKEHITIVNNQPEGVKKTFLAGGEPNTVEMWSAGKQNGETVVFQNGAKFAEVTYTNGVKNGVEKRYREDGQMIEEISWVNNEMHGPYRRYIADKVKTDWYFRNQPVSKGQFDSMSRPAPR